MSDAVKRKMHPDKPKRPEKGIFGIPKPKNPTFFTPNGEEWSSDDSDEDFRPGGRILAKKDTSESEAEADEIPTSRKRKKPRKISRIESDDDQDGGGSGKEDGDSSFAASDSDEVSAKGKEKKKGNGPTAVKRGKRRSYVDESNDSEEEDNSLNR